MESKNIQKGIIIEKIRDNNFTIEVKDLKLSEACDVLLSSYCNTVKKLVDQGLITTKLAKDVTLMQLNELLGEE